MNESTTQGDTHPQTASPAWQLDHWLVRQLFGLVGKPEIELQLWDGYRVGKTNSRITVCFLDRAALYRMLYKPTYTFGVLYASSRLAVNGDMVLAMEKIYQGLSNAKSNRGPIARWVSNIFTKKPRGNEQHISKRNIHAHYDLGNDFYKLWLDDETQYTCAYFAEPDYSLEQAQAAKLELVCRKLALQPGETVVEAGGGWGGLARYLVRKHGVKVHSYNISTAQIDYARQRARAEGLQDNIHYIEDDFRNIRGSFDAFVSVGMLEHVGPSNFTDTGSTIDRCLKDNGRGLIHTIGQISPRPLNEWIERNIFPGAQPPSLMEMMQIFEPHEFVVCDVENLRSHYAQTLHHWVDRFEQHQGDIERMFDPAFIRAWRVYLCGSAAAFTTGDLQLFQVLFSRPGCDKLPATRDHLFQTPLIADPAARK